MQDETKTALFVGGKADGWTNEFAEIQSKLNYHGSNYILKGTLETKNLGTVQVYVFENMKSEEENLRLEIIKKSL
jgi:hypothetical protein